MLIDRFELPRGYRYILWNESGSVVIGSAVIERSEDSVLLRDINLGREFRGEGVGTRLLEYILEDLGEFEIRVRTFRGRVGWYERHGFQRIREIGELVEMRRPPRRVSMRGTRTFWYELSHNRAPR